MAYMSQENKAAKAPAIKAIMKKYHVKGSLAVDNHSTLVLNIKSGSIDFIGSLNATCINQYCKSEFIPAVGYIQVNEYHYDSQFSGVALDFLNEVIEVMMSGNYNNSDIQSDYFGRGFYIDINIGKWNTPYILIRGQ